MERYYWVAIITIVFGFALFGMSLIVSRLRVTRGVAAPAIAGDPVFERAYRAHMNTVEWTPIFLPSMWLFAVYWNSVWAAGLGALWVIGRIIYFVGYMSNPKKRFIGMSIQAIATLVLSVGTLGRILYLVL